VAACAPTKTEPGSGETGESGTEAGTDSPDESDESDGTGGTDGDGSSEDGSSGSSSATGDTTGNGDGGGELVPCTEYEVKRPLEDKAYRLCMRGLADFTSHEFRNGEITHEAYAQFFRVYAESQVVWDEIVLDPHDGVDDCYAVDNGNSGSGESEQVLWEDAGDFVTFMGPDMQIEVPRYGDPVSVIGYDGSFGDAGYSPAWGGLYGFVAPGATTPPYDFPDSVHLPERIVVTSPSLEPGTTVPRDQLVVQWEAATLPTQLFLFLRFDLGGDRWVTIGCEMADDGQFQVPPEILEHAPLPAEANVYMSRTERQMVMLDDIYAIKIQGETSTEAKWWIE